MEPEVFPRAMGFLTAGRGAEAVKMPNKLRDFTTPFPWDSKLSGAFLSFRFFRINQSSPKASMRDRNTGLRSIIC